ncbi:MAG: TrkH family potassium uptake protein [Clostridium sp.]|nr:TrkH family potassium uptake protein [Clostridium sp.]
MNFRMVLKIIGTVIKYEAILLLLPLFVALYYKQSDAYAFLITALITFPIGLLLSKIKINKKEMYAKEGFLIVGISWIIISFVGGLPFVISGAIPSIIDSFFETVSGFTTTGATILTEIESLPKGILFWRSLTHWIGGMGFLIFILALIPSLGSNTIHLLKAESAGPSPSKIVPKMKETAKILYLIYFALTILETVLLMFAGLSFYDAIIHALGTAGTGGFSNKNASVAAFNNPAAEWIITIFMLLFGVNFALYFYVIKGKIKEALMGEELRFYILTVISATVLITINILDINSWNIGESIRQSAFQVSSIMTTTGYATTDFNLWPTFSKIILLVLMFFGGMAGSTAGGVKNIRILILAKTVRREINKILHPKRVKCVKIDGRVVSEEVTSSIALYIVAYAMITLVAMLIVSIDGFDFTTTTTSVLTTMNNVGPGFEMVGPVGNFSAFSGLSKIVLSLCMLIGRLEIYPILIMFSSSLWKRKY